MSQNRKVDLGPRSLHTLVKRLGRACVLLMIFGQAFTLSAFAGDKQGDLSGLWLVGDQNERFSQVGGKLKGVLLDEDPSIQKVYGFTPGITDLLATVSGRTIRGKILIHFAVVPFKANCPQVWSYWADLELTESPDGNKLAGRWKSDERDKSNCRVLRTSWVPIQYTRHHATEITHEARGIRISLEGAILFDFDRYVLKPDAEAVLSQIKSTVIDQHPNAKLVVEGHTDDRGSVDYNLLLSQQRAESVADWLKQHGVLSSRLEVKGYGKSRPKYPNDSEENRYRNRRVEILVLTTPASASKQK